MEGLKVTATDRESESCPDRTVKMSIVKERTVTISRTISHRKTRTDKKKNWREKSLQFFFTYKKHKKKRTGAKYSCPLCDLVVVLPFPHNITIFVRHIDLFGITISYVF